ncbi:uncharacterized protein LTHEOB_12971 [Lasiodiplodia theobromae]|uniref:uncharacterized protein n=1 Tax=Lasiodiplodia theobromae TaxID=45133 RepID=UPI0015C2CDC4|nr:uncharacterized protein LTHEOB_12971 [Lasiodiplodia theobromae]KAF4534215.1 hypothetical protein LTHEOB_12971 [Lasiodiplodia theobromae]
MDPHLGTIEYHEPQQEPLSSYWGPTEKPLDAVTPEVSGCSNVPGDQLHGIRKAASTPLRKSERVQKLRQLAAARQLQEPVSSIQAESTEEYLEVYPAQGVLQKRKLHKTQPPSLQFPEQAQKRPRSAPVDAAREETADENYNNPIDYWRKHDYRWPKEPFDPDASMNTMLARKKSSSSSLRRRARGADSVTDTASDSVPYQNPLYTQHLAQFGVFMEEDEAGVAKTSKETYMLLLTAEQTVPQQSLFCDHLFKSTCRNIETKNEARVIRDIGLLIVPSAEHLAAAGAEDLVRLIESTNETWSGSIKIYGPEPKPDYSVGFRWNCFTQKQIKRLEPFIGDLEDESLFKATSLMYFPFLTCEVKCGAAALDVADRQNAHSMGVAMRGVVALFRRVKREEDLQRAILGFSISHDHRMVRIYGHYPVIDGEETMYYRHLIHAFDFTGLDGKERWTSYKFVKSVYERWMPKHFKNICSAIEALPLGVIPAAPQLSETQPSEQTGVTQDITGFEPAASVESTDVITPNTSVSHKGSKQRRKRKHQNSGSLVEH